MYRSEVRKAIGRAQTCFILAFCFALPMMEEPIDGVCMMLGFRSQTIHMSPAS